MKKTPDGWSRMSSNVFYEDPAAAIDWLCRVFGFEVRLKVEGEKGEIVHSELTYGEGMIMVGGTEGQKRVHPLPAKSPRQIGGAVTQSICVFVDDPDAHCKHAKAEGATIVDEPTTSDYGEDYWADRSYRAIDLEGHHWWFMHRVRG